MNKRIVSVIRELSRTEESINIYRSGASWKRDRHSLSISSTRSVLSEKTEKMVL